MQQLPQEAILPTTVYPVQMNGERNENNLPSQEELVSSKVITTGNRTVETFTVFLAT